MIEFLSIILSPAVFVYSAVIKIRNYFFDSGIFKIQKVNAKVISIGNLTVGGSGKTPAVIYVTNLLKENGKKAGILSRGYRRNSKGYLLVSDGNEIKTTVDKCGDEMYLVTDECRVPSCVSENRVEGARNFLNDVQIDTIVLDDAFQHRWIHRDLDILMFDQRFLSKVGSKEQKPLPLGTMRESFNSIDRADVIIINRKFTDKKEIPTKLQKYFKNKKIFHAYYQVDGIIDLKTHQKFSIEEFQGQKSLIVSGIAKPFSFLNILEKNNIDFTNKLLFVDHKNYSHKEVQNIRKKFYETNAYSVITTQKDAVKLMNYSKELDDIDIYYVRINLAIEEKEDFKETVLTIFNSIN